MSGGGIVQDAGVILRPLFDAGGVVSTSVPYAKRYECVGLTSHEFSLA